MFVSEAQLLESSNGWYVETKTGSEGPLENETDATDYLALLNVVHAARAGIACCEHDYPEVEMI